jgi:hypothetical protein
MDSIDPDKKPKVSACVGARRRIARNIQTDSEIINKR